MLKVLIAEPSYLIRKGLSDILGQFPEVTGIEVLGTHLGLSEILEHYSPDLLLINTSIAAVHNEKELKKSIPASTRVIHLINTPLPSGSPLNQISILDSKLTIIEKLTACIKPAEGELEHETSEELTPREKLILEHVARGLTNKEIASKLFISTHTVISHRKNITRKLQIKSVSGLTVYAILNGLIKMEDLS